MCVCVYVRMKYCRVGRAAVLGVVRTDGVEIALGSQAAVGAIHFMASLSVCLETHMDPRHLDAKHGSTDHV